MVKKRARKSEIKITCEYCQKDLFTRYINKKFCNRECKGKWFYRYGRPAVKQEELKNVR